MIDLEALDHKRKTLDGLGNKDCKSLISEVERLTKELSRVKGEVPCLSCVNRGYQQSCPHCQGTGKKYPEGS